ncbi:hypothetical protein BDV12DRAFT_198586 [Aspergillus spectabilis]
MKGTVKAGVTLTTTKAQELAFFLRPSYMNERSGFPEGNPKADMHPNDARLQTRIGGKDIPFYRPEPANLFRRLPEVKPPVLYLFGDKSDLSSFDARWEKMSKTGIGLGGSGGVPRGLVQEVVLLCGHMVPMELVRESAEASAEFIHKRVRKWEVRVWKYRKAWEGVSDR